jgi:hypothetical protein
MLIARLAAARLCIRGHGVGRHAQGAIKAANGADLDGRAARQRGGGTRGQGWCGGGGGGGGLQADVAVAVAADVVVLAAAASATAGSRSEGAPTGAATRVSVQNRHPSCVSGPDEAGPLTIAVARLV